MEPEPGSARSESGAVHPKFLRWLRTRSGKWWDSGRQARHVGAVFDSLRCRDIPNFELTVPPPADQAEIAGECLDARRPQTTLREATATRSYRRRCLESWFVDFDPVRAKSPGSRRPAWTDEATAALFPMGLRSRRWGAFPGLVGRQAGGPVPQRGLTRPLATVVRRVSDHRRQRAIRHARRGDGQGAWCRHRTPGVPARFPNWATTGPPNETHCG